MAVYSKSFWPLPGINYVEDSDLVGAQIIKVARNDMTLWWDGTTPTGTDSKYVHDHNTGRITVSADNPFILSIQFFPPRTIRFIYEKFKVIYKK